MIPAISHGPATPGSHPNHERWGECAWTARDLLATAWNHWLASITAFKPVTRADLELA